MALSDELKTEIDGLVQSNRVVLFMKGSRQFPQCGFSARVAGLLDELLDDYHTINVLARPEVREGIKEYSDWPTIPQLFVDGKFVGGCDIVEEMAGTGELYQTLGVEPPAAAAPQITITDAARTAFEEARSEAGGDDPIRLTVSRSFQHDLSIAPGRSGDLQVEANGVLLVVDRFSAARANGLTIDFVNEGLNAGFKMDNPNAPNKS